MKDQNTQPIGNQKNEQPLQPELTVADSSGKKPFIEPTVSVPTDVLDATTFFQSPTIEVSGT